VANERTKAFEDLLHRYVGALKRLVRSYAREPAEQDDLLQEIALGLWTALPMFRGEARERTWLYRVAHNTAISYATSRKRRNRREQGGTIPDLPGPANGSESTVIEDEQRARLWAAIQELPLIC
jgi:RNA polymerase sigma-70 factor (ECF subfamily)